MIHKNEPEIDIIREILNAVLEVHPHSTFAKSLWHQYQERGSLSKKQLEGLYDKACKIKAISPARIATLQARMIKRPNRYKSSLPPTKPLYVQNEKAGMMIKAILQQYPQHKQVLFLQSRYNNNESFTIPELAQLEKFYKLLVKKDIQ
jgi:hypothetical protein